MESRLPLCLGYPSKWVKVSSGLQANFSARVTLSPLSTLQALLTGFVMRDILCNSPIFEIILKFEFSVENTFNSQKRGKYYRRRKKITCYFSDAFIIKLRNFIIPFKLARLLVTHDGRKLTRVGELSLAERLEGKLQCYPPAL